MKRLSILSSENINIHVAGLVFFILAISTNPAISQIGGQQSFQFLNTSVSARMAGTSGVNVSYADKDVNYFFSNPALNGDTLSGVASVNYQFYVGDVGHSAFAYTTDLKKVGVISFGIQHVSYGLIKSYDETGMEIGDFKSGETSLNISKAHQVGNYRIGATLKGVFSNLAGYRATAVATDLGMIFLHPEQDLSIGLVVKNLGIVLSDYSVTANSSLPLDVRLGTTFKPQHMPLRFSLTAYNLTNTENFDNPSVDSDNVSSVNKVLNHLGIGTEILLHRNVDVLLGYNFLNHQQLKLEEGGGGAGITFGFTARIKKFELVISRAAYVAGNAVYAFTLSGNLNKLIKRA